MTRSKAVAILARIAGKGTRAIRTGLGALLVGLLLLAFAGSASAAVTEQVQDGGFEATTCPPPPHTGQTALECVNPIWPEEFDQGFACRMPPCGPGPASGLGFFTFGGLPPRPGGIKFGMTQQEIEVPVAPATLTFKIERQARTVEGELHVFLDSVSLGKFGSELPASYQQQTFDVSSLAGPGLQTLQFLYRCMKAEETELCPIYNLDDVSLTTGTPDPPAPPPPVLTQPALPVSSPPPAATPPQALKCKKGFRKKTVKGKKRCVRKPRKGKGSK